MDGFKGHETAIETLQNLCDIADIVFMKIPAHSSDQIQPLDLFGFNLQKNRTGKFIVNPFYTWQTNQILAIIEGLSTIRSPHAIMTAWEMSGIYRTRIYNGSVDDPNIQYHSINIYLNDHIRGMKSTQEKLKGSHHRRRKYETKEPTMRYPKKKEMKLKTSADVARPKITKEEAEEMITKLGIKKKVYSTDDVYKITDFFPPKKTPNQDKNSQPKKRIKKKRKFRVARFHNLPDTIDIDQTG